MERIQSQAISRLLPVLLVALLGNATGCKTVRTAKHEVTDAVGLTEHSAPTNLHWTRSNNSRYWIEARNRSKGRARK